jgi:large subunit ribosomal protein L6
MSRIGKKPISLPAGVSVKVESNNLLKVKGPKGELLQQIDPDLIVEVEGNELTINRPTEQKRHRAMHGLYRTLVQNMVTGVSEGYEIKLEVVGVGFRAEAQGNKLTLALGFSHPIVMIMPPEIKVETESARGKAPVIKLQSNDKQLIGQIAAKIRSYRPPEPYKGKGVRFVGEQIRRKAGKTASK